MNKCSILKDYYDRFCQQPCIYNLLVWLFVFFMVDESWRTENLEWRHKTPTLWLNSGTMKKTPKKVCVCVYWKPLKLKQLKGIFVVAKALKWQIWNSHPYMPFSLKTSNKAYFSEIHIHLYNLLDLTFIGALETISTVTRNCIDPKKSLDTKVIAKYQTTCIYKQMWLYLSFLTDFTFPAVFTMSFIQLVSRVGLRHM